MLNTQLKILIQLGIPWFCFPLGCIAGISNRHFNHLDFARLPIPVCISNTRDRTRQNTGLDFSTKRGKFQGGSFISLEKIKCIWDSLTKYLLPDLSAKLLPTSPPPCLSLLPRSPHTSADLTPAALHRAHKKSCCVIKTLWSLGCKEGPILTCP